MFRGVSERLSSSSLSFMFVACFRESSTFVLSNGMFALYDLVDCCIAAMIWRFVIGGGWSKIFASVVVIAAVCFFCIRLGTGQIRGCDEEEGWNKICGM